jgi:uncharacterized protein (TIGR02271 family)
LPHASQNCTEDTRNLRNPILDAAFLPETGGLMAVPDKTEALPLVEETLRVRKRQVSAGKVRVHSVIDTIDELVRETLQEEKVEVSRVPINEVVTVIPSVRTENGVVIVPIVEEVLVIEKRILLKEEVHIHRHVSQETVEVPVTLRKQRAVVERIDANGEPMSKEEEP